MASPGESDGDRTFSPLSQKFTPPSRVHPECCIFKVHHHLCETHSKAYKPQIVAIGPYHPRTKYNNLLASSSTSTSSSEPNFSMMEELKLWYFNKVVERNNKPISIDDLKNEVKYDIKRVRNFYAEPLLFNDDELVEMMVLDGCFIVELARKNSEVTLRDPNDPIFNIEWIMNCVQRDLLLFENQIPLFIVNKLFNLIDTWNDGRFVSILLDFFDDILPEHEKPRRCFPCNLSLVDIKHLVELIHLHWCSDVSEHVAINIQQPETPSSSNRLTCCCCRRKTERKKMGCATELRDAGVDFECQVVEGRSFFDIKFQNKTLQIPTIVIEDRTETLLRNLIAYEQYWDRNSDLNNHRTKFATEYVDFLDNLINSSKDVEILCRRGVIHNLLGDDNAVADIFNKITDSVIVGRNGSRYSAIEDRLILHCRRRRNRWIAKLRQNQCNSPWRILSVVAGLLLLFLTSTQTYFTVFPRE